MLNNLLQIQLKLLEKEQFKKAAKATGDLIANKNLLQNNSEKMKKKY